MFKNHPSLLLVILIAFVSCSVEPQPIDYGKDACVFCKMNIVDRQHAAEFVTKKGKVYKFDAIECMMNQMNEFDGDIAIYLVSDYSKPGELTDAVTASYLKSQAIPSPMGGFLTSFADNSEAVKTEEEVGGELFDWNALKSRYDL